MPPSFKVICRVGLLLVVGILPSSTFGADNLPRFDAPFPDLDKPAAGYPLLEGVEHFPVYHATKAIGLYSHHAQLAHHDGHFYASWSSHAVGEDLPGQRILASFSSNGESWSKPLEIFPPQNKVVFDKQSPRGRAMISLAWVPLNQKMYAVALVNRCGRLARRVSADGKLGPIFWLETKPPAPVKGFPKYPSSNDPRFVELARQINDYLLEPTNMTCWGWGFLTPEAGKPPFHLRADDGTTLFEPTTYRRPDGHYVRFYRDLGPSDYLYSHRVYASIGSSDGTSWTVPTQTNIPDSPSRIYAGSLPDGRCYFVGNQLAKPVVKRVRWHYTRDPLTISVSRDGISFDFTAAIRIGAPKVREKGLYKAPGFQYPAATIVGKNLWVLYSVGKEDMEISRVPLKSLER